MSPEQHQDRAFFGRRKGHKLRPHQARLIDIADYAAWTLQRLLRSADFEWTAQCADEWRKPWPGFIHTRYHAKAARQERTSCFLIFRKV
jgi:tRNA G46 methylase TrmB